MMLHDEVASEQCDTGDGTVFLPVAYPVKHPEVG